MPLRCNPVLHRPLALALLVCLLALLPATLATAQPGGDGVFTVRHVAVDVTATSAALARDKAIQDAQRQAFATLFDRLTLDADGRSPPALDPAQLEQLVDSFEVEEERTSPVRYVGSMTIRFRPAAVRTLMLGSGIRYAEVRAKPVLVIPVDETGGAPALWQRETPWRAAWDALEPQEGLLPVLVPYGDLADVTDIGVEQALAGDEAALRRIADRYGAGSVAIARLGLDGELTLPSVPPADASSGFLDRFAPVPQAEPAPAATPVPEPVPPAADPAADRRPRGLMAVVSHYPLDGPPGLPGQPLVPEVLVVEVPPLAATPPAPDALPGADAAPADPAPGVPGTAQPADPALPPDAPAEAGLPVGVVDLMPTAVAQVVDGLEQRWIAANLLETGRQNSLPVTVPIATLDEWMETRRRLADVPIIARSTLVSLARDRADLTLHYLGDPGRLRTALAQRDLQLMPPPPAPPGVVAPATAEQRWTLIWAGATAAGSLLPVTPAPGVAPPADAVPPPTPVPGLVPSTFRSEVR